MKTITFVSHYNKLEIDIRISDEKAEKLFGNKNEYRPIDLYEMDILRLNNDVDPKYFSKGQIKKLISYHLGIDFWDDIIVKH